MGGRVRRPTTGLDLVAGCGRGRQDLGLARSGWGTARFCQWQLDLATRGHIYFFLICRCRRRLVWLATLARPRHQRHTKEVFFFIKYGCPQIRVGGKNLSLSRVDEKNLS